MADGGVVSVTRVDPIMARQGQEFFLDALNQLVKVASWQVIAADGFTEKSIACDDQFLLWKDKGNTTPGVTRGLDHLELEAVQIIGPIVLKELFCWLADDIWQVVVSGLAREIVQRRVEPAGLIFRYIDGWLAKSFSNPL